jgi:hypothetical protein
MDKDIELKNCPMCDGESNFGTVKYSKNMVKEQGWSQDKYHFVSCVQCITSNKGLVHNVGHGTKEKAAEHWNTRAPQIKWYNPKELPEEIKTEEFIILLKGCDEDIDEGYFTMYGSDELYFQSAENAYKLDEIKSVTVKKELLNTIPEAK